MNNQEIKNLKRHIKKLDRRIKYLNQKLEYQREYIKDLEDIEDNDLTCILRDIKNEEMVYFDYSCALNEEELLEYHITIKRKYIKGETNV